MPSISIYGPHFGAGWEVVGHLPGWRPGEQRKEAGLESERQVGGWAQVEEKSQVWCRIERAPELVRPCFLARCLDLEQLFLGSGRASHSHQAGPMGPLCTLPLSPFTLVS